MALQVTGIHNVETAQAEAQRFPKVTWWKEPCLRKLYALSAVVCLASATTGYDGSMLNVGSIDVTSSKTELILGLGTSNFACLATVLRSPRREPPRTLWFNIFHRISCCSAFCTLHRRSFWPKACNLGWLLRDLCWSCRPKRSTGLQDVCCLQILRWVWEHSCAARLTLTLGT